MEYTEHYDNMEQRNSLCSVAASNGFRCIHDTFDEDWQKGDEPHGTLTFTDVMPEPEPKPERQVFTRLNPLEGVEPRLNHIENWLKERYPE